MRSGDIIAGRYRLDSPLGEGGLGVVWLATQISLNRTVAIKFVKVSDADTVRRFEIEAQALARLAHPNCVTTFEFGRLPDDVPFLVMEHVRGETLAAQRGRQVDLDSVVAIAEQLLAALAHAHTSGVVHRDLKPENIILIPGPRQTSLKVLDFGLAKLAGRTTPDITKTGEVMGTPQYMSPEQLRGTRDAGAPSDVYSVGVILYELVEGQLPFRGPTMLELAMAHIHEPAPPVVRPDIPPQLRKLIADMLAKEASARPTAAAALRRLERPAPQAPTAETAKSANSAVSARTLGIAIGCLGILIAAAVNRTQSAEEKTPSIEERRHARLPPTMIKGGEAPADVGLASSMDPRDLGPGKPEDGCEVVADTGFHKSRDETAELRKSEWVTYLPRSYDPTRRYPVVALLQNNDLTAKGMMEETGFRDIADKEGFILVATEVGPWPWREDIFRELELVRHAVETTHATYCTDRTRTFVVGHGSGATGAARLSCASWVTAVATASYLPAPDEKRCAEPKPAITIAPRDTKHVPFEGGVRCYTGTEAVSVAEMDKHWQARNGCKPKPTKTSPTDGVCFRYDCNEAFMSCHIRGGRDWPGTPMKGLDPLHCDTQPSSFPSAKVIWDFFKTVRPSVSAHETEVPPNDAD